MVAVDTNVVLRLVTGDDPAQTAVAQSVLSEGVWISHVVLAETAWALRAIYRLDHGEIARLLQMLLEIDGVTIQETDVAVEALEQYRRRPALRCSDCLILAIARKSALPLVTFDNLSRPSTARGAWVGNDLRRVGCLLSRRDAES